MWPTFPRYSRFSNKVHHIEQMAWQSSRARVTVAVVNCFFYIMFCDDPALTMQNRLNKQIKRRRKCTHMFIYKSSNSSLSMSRLKKCYGQKDHVSWGILTPLIRVVLDFFFYFVTWWSLKIHEIFLSRHAKSGKDEKSYSTRMSLK